MLEQRLIAEEQMDDPGLDDATYRAVLRDLARVNRVTLAHRPTLDFLRRVTRGGAGFRLLDVGFGDGDMLRAIARWAEARGLEVELVGIDINPRSQAVARESTTGSFPITYYTGDYADVIGRDFDFVISSLVAHHMSHRELVAFIAAMESHAERGWFVNDLHRHRFAYAAYPLLAAFFGWHPIVRSDGRLSIARSYRPDEWPAILAEAEVKDARVRRYSPFRLCVEKLR